VGPTYRPAESERDSVAFGGVPVPGGYHRPISDIQLSAERAARQRANRHQD